MARKQTENTEAQRYLGVIATYEREFKSWETRVEKILKRYRDENRVRKDQASSKFNILWSNVQTLVPATFAKLPQPDVSRRFKDNDPVGRVAALILERCLEFEIQHYNDYRMSLKQTVYDRFLGGRGTIWARYEPHFRAGNNPDDGLQVTEDTDEAPVDERLDYECAPVDYVHWKDFGHDVARTWEEVTLVWRRVYMSESAVTERFGEEIAKSIPYDATPEDLKRSGKYDEAVKKQALVIELWDKENGIAVWLSKSNKEILDQRPDPLGLKEFFPCPRPLYSTLTNDSLIPVPDYTLYQDQANDLDILADRIDGLTRMLQVKGVYDGSMGPEVARLFTEGTNGTLIPIKNWQAFAEKNGLKGAIDVYDITPIAKGLEVAALTMEQVKNQIYEIMGIGDIIRGVSDPNETLGAQEIKSNFASLRLKNMQGEVAEFASAVLQLKAQIICAKFAPQTIAAISAVEQLSPEDQQLVYLMAPGPVDPQTGQPGPAQPVPGPDGKPQPLGPAMQLLLGEARIQDPEADTPNPLRAFRVEIAADTLIQLDEMQEKQDRMELLTSFGAYLEKAAQAAMAAPQMMPLIMEMGKFAVTSFKIGKAIEGTFDQALDQIKEQAAQPKPPPPDPEMEKVKMQAQAEQARMQMEQQKGQAEMQMEGQRMQAEQANNQATLQMEAQKAQMQVEADKQIAAIKLAGEKEIEMYRIQSQERCAAMTTESGERVARHKAESDGDIQRQKIERDAETAQYKADTDADVKSDIAKQAGKVPGKSAKDKREADAIAREDKRDAERQKVDKAMIDVLDKLAKSLTAPKRIVRGADGRAAGVESA